jgi:hypothetical protein
MSADTLVPNGPFCSCIDCTEPADAVIQHRDHGRRVVCEDHVNGHEVIDDV